MPRTLVLCCLLVLMIAPLVMAQQYDLRCYSLEQGMPSATVSTICEDPRGYLWVGTNEGIARTEGARFKVFGRREGLPSDDITATCCTSDGRIWVGCRSGAIAMIIDEEPHVITTGDPAWGPIRKIDHTSDGALWFATANGGLWRSTQGSLEKITAPGAPPVIMCMVVDHADRVIVGAEDGLFLLEEKGWRRVLEAELPDPKVLSLFADEQGLLIGTAAGHMEVDTALAPLPPAQRFTGHFPIALPDPRITSILRATNGDLWLGTPSGIAHLMRVAGQPLLRMISEANGLGHNLVRTLYQDRTGAIWCGTGFGGLCRSTGDAFIHFTDRDGLRSRIVSAIHRTPDDLLWFATAGGGIAVWDGRELQNLGREHGLPDPYVITISEDAGGRLLAGTATQGVFRWNGDRFEKIVSASPPGARIHVLERDPLQRLWVGHDKGIRVVPLNGDPIDLELSYAVMDITMHDDTAWIATEKGVHITPLHTPTALLPHEDIPPHPALSLVFDHERQLWIGTDGHGLLRWRRNALDSITTEHNTMGLGSIGSNPVLSLLLDAYQNVWAGTRRGIHELQLDVMQEMVLNVRQIGAEGGSIGMEVFRNAAMLDTDSTIWFGTLRGASRYDARSEVALEDPPILHLTNLELFFEETDWSRWSDTVTAEGIPKGLSLPYQKNHLTFHFSGISLAAPEQVRYRYILKGHDPEYSPITATERVTYSNIPPGDYTFVVEARSAGGNWTPEPLEFHFTIVAPLWQRTWFQGILFLALAVLIVGLFRYREMRSRKVKARLENMVADRTRELAIEQQRSDDLLLNILPKSTAEELKTRGMAQTRHYENCTVIFTDFTGFTSMSSHMNGDQLVADLDHFFRLFDRVTDEYGVEKIKTIGDAYMCACGIPEPKPSHALDAVLTALRMLVVTRKSNSERRALGKSEWSIRIGVHSGPIVAGVVGEKKFAYDIWGDTVNLASRMESNSDPGRINISGATYAQVMEFVEARPRGPIKVRGKGESHMYFVERLRPSFSADDEGLVPNERLLRIRDEMAQVLLM